MNSLLSFKKSSLSILILALMLALLSCSGTHAEFANEDTNDPPKDDLSVSVMSFNIRYGSANDSENSWDNRRDMVYDVIRNSQSDINGLQEALRFQLDQISETLPEYDEIGVGRDDGKTSGEYSAILYRKDRFDVDESGTFWFSDTPEIPGSITWGNACTRICTWAHFVDKKAKNAFYVYNLHLDHVSQSSREKSVVLLTEKINNRTLKDPYIVTGDFNAGEDNPAIRFLKGESQLSYENNNELSCPTIMTDSFRVLYPDAVDVGTFGGFKGNRKGAKIDYVLISSGINVIGAGIDHTQKNGRDPSDHFPVTAELQFQK